MWLLLSAVAALVALPGALAKCPWSRDLVDLHADCICAYSSTQRLSVQCSPVNFARLMNALHASAQNSLHLARCQLRQVSERALQGLENSLASLSLPDNRLEEVPVAALRRLASLRQLDLSSNAIRQVPDGAFSGLPLNTLKLADNELNIADDAFAGLQDSLKNLNLKGTGQERVPRAASQLTSLAFLDLAQNKIASLAPEDLSGMHTLTALNLERNRIVKIDADAFAGINDTLSSLSLLNNLLVEFPGQALATLTELRVLDLGFNGIRNLPDDAFANNPFLTLLALDGNPMATIPLEPFRHLNTTLRGISIGGPYLECDCRIRWIAEWIANKDLQTTSLPSRCKELKLERYVIAHLDKIIIASSAAVCGIIILAVIIFLCCWRKKQSRSSGHKSRLPLPTSTVHPTIKPTDEWETVSMYSSRSIPRARMYHMDNANGSVNQSFVMDDNRSHISHFSHMPNGYSSKARSTADGQSHRSYSQMSNKYRGLGNPEVRKSQQSLSALSGTHSFLDAHVGPTTRPLANGKKRVLHNGRLASASSMHSLNEYDSDWNARTENWKDNEVDIYVGQSHVAPSHSKYHHR
ncbi:hypothetical protein MRX96_032245 [Rhipicephalus microplus]